MKIKFLLLYFFLLPLTFVFGQVGINTQNPMTTLDVNGTIANREILINITGTSVTVPATMSQVRIEGSPASNFIINADPGLINGQRLVIVNNTTNYGSLNGVIIGVGMAVEFIYSDGNWRSTIPESTLIGFYSSQVKIPPTGPEPDFTNHSVTSYDFNDWFVISKTTIPGSSATSPFTPYKMIIVYEYQGTPFTLDKLYPIFTPGNSTSYPDTFLVNFININNSTGKTRLTVSVVRVDSIPSGWSGVFLINMLLINSSL
jgi:hypothetical protein